MADLMSMRATADEAVDRPGDRPSHHAAREHTWPKTAAARMALLNRVTRKLSEAGVAIAPLLAAVAEQIATEAADACSVVLFEDGERVRRSTHHPEHRRASAAEILDEDSPDSNDRFRCSVPLVASGRVLGLVRVFRDPEGAPFSEDDRELIVEIVERAALVIERTLLFEASGMARRRAELLYELAGVVIRAEDSADVLETALDAIGHAVQANRAAVLVCDAEGVMRFRAFRGLSDGYRAAVEGHSPWSRGERAPLPIVIADARKSPAMQPLLPIIEAEGIRALAFIPLVTEGKILGKFMLYFDEPRELSSQEIDISVAIANHVAAAVARLDALAELRQTVRFNEMFTAVLGHDLRNPLGAIMTAAQLAMKRSDDERLLKPLGRIVSSGQRMARMIDQLLDFTRVRVGAGLPLSPKELDVLVLLRRLLDQAGQTAPGFASSLEASGDTVGDWDEERLGQVFGNLIGNAVQHGIPAFGMKVRVDGTRADQVEIQVVSGGTVPRELIAKLFDPMTGGEGRREKAEGLGLGLFISKQIVRAHGGTIDVDSSESCETIFRVVLPRAASRAPGMAR